MELPLAAGVLSDSCNHRARAYLLSVIMAKAVVTVLGGTGFLGRRLVAALSDAGYAVRVGARHPLRGGSEIPDKAAEPVTVDIRDKTAIHAAVSGAEAVINAVSLYEEQGELTFEAIHVRGAARVAQVCREEGVALLVQLSGIGVDKPSPSSYIRARARGEVAVRQALPAATLLRPAVMFGPADALLSNIERATRMPVVPLFGRGDTRLQPIHVEDVAAAITRIVQRRHSGRLFELGGAETLSYRALVAAVCRELGRRRWLMPFPFALWKPLVRAMAILPNPPMNIDQLYLMAIDNVADTRESGCQDLDITPRAVTDLIGECLR